MLRGGKDAYWGKKARSMVEGRSKRGTLYDGRAAERARKGLEQWEETVYREWTEGHPGRGGDFQTASGIPVKPLYTPDDVADYPSQGFPGVYPFLRGIYPDMYRGRLWTMRMFSGFGTPEDTNKRLKMLLDHGETGLSIAFDMPTLYGYDCDHERAHGEVGRCGVNVSSLRDMEVVFRGIPLGKVSTSMTINAPATVLTCMYAGVAKKQGVPMSQLRGTVQADMLKEYIAQKEWAYPPEAHLRLVRDLMVFSTREMPLWNYISISGYHIREAGSSAVQELAFTLADGFGYVELGLEAGLKVEQFAPRLSFFFNSTMDFFEEIAKFRAARRIWATVLREKYGVKDKRSLHMRFHTQTSGASLTWQQPLNNVVRTAIEALAAVLGGTQSLHTNSYDEAWALPTEQAAEVALRTQQVIAEETGVPNVIDPLGGSYYVEWLTEQMEEEAYKYFDRIDAAGGLLKAVKTGYLQREIAENSYRLSKRVEEGKDSVVGVNKYAKAEKEPIDTLKIDFRAQRAQMKRMATVKRERDEAKVRGALAKLEKAFENDDANAMYPMLEAVVRYATLGEVMGVGRKVWGSYKEPMIL
ncbi:MAG: methylmalonyl-CoA mutase family protein [Nitrososphaerota archaeon]|jgi:methylmalonyl-CoA mutase N-terminal domain/subunit|nr:methylmalonyl-CoA mutase family protein [Nitrososphaerota archaeon]MCL5672837.1 methylmalonyl-CoA mutase family protein [Nitrososphaerota archaeon]MDG6937334.1 methylmalonyl-CoA mutase family protein [Nitrososphaerota archaeon]MDG6958692.1 methylmalonyl-CoA mutase family protein [Nitrososphaerota archaeon]MDG6961753.1 methylmalonyl-CoA mutase family protein [Nitrososphaerota archaeon]